MAATARIHNVRVTVDQAGRDPRALSIVHRLRAPTDRQIRLRAHPRNGTVTHRERTVFNRTIISADHRRQMRVQPNRIPLCFTHLFSPAVKPTVPPDVPPLARYVHRHQTQG